ncbi:MAG: TIGR03960 family B12-binding radical SAM protein [Myxococcales bacterium]|nr:MAG: TIGR03960 family B12-binding radical SAM protein [Myxococcales bacterium]
MAVFCRRGNVIFMLHAVLQQVDKPGRYLGCEVNAVIKRKEDVRLRVCLAFPDVYEVGFSHLGLKVLYQILNDRPEFWAERVYAPWLDMAGALRAHGLPLFALESKDPLTSFDWIGFSLQYELCAAQVLAMLDLAGIPLRAQDRTDAHPLVIGGGPNAANPEPLADFFDAFFLGEAEEAVLEVCDAVAAAKARGLGRRETLLELAKIEGVYVPAFFAVETDAEGRLLAVRPTVEGLPLPRRRIVADLDGVSAVSKPLVPVIEPVHDRVAVEIQRGCTRGCRFCQAGMLYRPARQRSPQAILQSARDGLAATGHDTLGLLSLSASDYHCLEPLAAALYAEHGVGEVSLQLPSLRVETLNSELAERLNQGHKTAFTLAPETASDRLRRVINKGNSEEDLLAAARTVFAAGWKHLKLYFMIGLPTETDDDVLAIIELARRVRDIGRDVRRGAEVTIAVGTFVPKPHTPFQWHRMASADDIERRLKLLKEGMIRYKLSFKWHEAKSSLLEGALARGDRRLGRVIEIAYRLGARFDAWTEQLNLDRWRQAFAECGLDFESYLGREFGQDDVLPWSHLDYRVEPAFLWQEYENALAEVARTDCAYSRCHDCGVCDHQTIRRELFAPPGEKTAPHVATGETPPVLSARPPMPTGARVVRFQYAKQDYAVFLGHLDVMSQVARAFRRAGIRLKMSEGFRPKPRIAFSQALPLGAASTIEFFDAELFDPAPVPALVARLNRALPHGLTVLDGRQIAAATPSLSESIVANVWRISLGGTRTPEQATAAVAAFGEAASVEVTRPMKNGEKRLDLKLWIEALDDLGEGAVQCAVRASAEGSLKPAEILSGVFGLDDAERRKVRIEKVAVRFAPPKTIHNGISGKMQNPTKYTDKLKEKAHGAKTDHQRHPPRDTGGVGGKRGDRRAVYRKETG